MFGKLPKVQLLITSPCFSNKQTTTTSLSRHNFNLFTTKALLLVCILLFIFLTANGSGIKRKSGMKTFEDNWYLRKKLLKFVCEDCLQSRKPEAHLLEKDNDKDKSVLERSKELAKLFHLACDGLSYRKCLALNRLMEIKRRWKPQINHHYDAAILTATTNDDVSSNEQQLQPHGTTTDRVSSRLSHPLSRQKRFALGDRRLVHLYCKTRYVLEILEDGKVVGNPTKTDNSVLEIQSVAPNGVVRFYSPSTKYFLAMNDRGILYGTKTYSEKHCAFIERIQDNMWSTYSSQTLPNKRRKKHPRSKRSAKREWYVAIGKTGKPRKASRISPRQSSAQFLPRPAT